MAIPMPKLIPPQSGLMLEQSHFLHPKSRHDDVMKDHPFNYQMDIAIPLSPTSDAPESIESLHYHKYYEACIQISSIIHPAFVEAFIKRGKFQLVSCQKQLDCDDVFGLTPSGHLYLHLTKESYEKLGLVGKLSHQSKSKYLVDLDLCSSAYRPGAKYYERVKMCITNHLPRTFEVVFTWTPVDHSISTTSLLKYFRSIGYPCKEVEPCVTSKNVEAFNNCPVLNPHNPMCEDSTAINYTAFWEWLGASTCDIYPDYDTPEPSMPITSLYKHRVTGLINVNDIVSQLEQLRELSRRYAWCSLTVSGFADSPTTWKAKEHCYRMDGDNLYTFVVFPDGSYWLYSALGSNHDISVFVFDKSSISKLKEKKQIMESVYRHIDILKSMQKYSTVSLKLVLSAKENRKYLAYATEPVIGSLANALGDYPNDITTNRSSFFNKFSLSEVEIKYGITLVAETLSYLHLAERLVHCDVSPRNILVCADRSWKLAGYHFTTAPDSRLSMVVDPSPSKHIHDLLQPDVNFTAPALFLKPPTSDNDVFSLGMVITSVYNQGISLLEGTAVISQIYDTSGKSSLEADYNEKVTCALNAIKSRIPDGLRLGVSRLISFSPEKRPTAQQFLMLAYFQDPAIKCLKQLATLDTISDKQKEEFYCNQLPEGVRFFPQILLHVHVYPLLTQELSSHNWSPGIMKLLIAFLEKCRSTPTLQALSPEVNKIFLNSYKLTNQEVASAVDNTSLQILLDKLPFLIELAKRVSCLNDPLELVANGLKDDCRVKDVLSVISHLAAGKFKDYMPINTKLLTIVKSCLEKSIKQTNQELSSLVLSMLFKWMTLLSHQTFTEDVVLWLTDMLGCNFDYLEKPMLDLWSHFLCSAHVIKLTKEFVRSQIMKPTEDMFVKSDISMLQRQSLMQLVRKLEAFCTSSTVPACQNLCQDPPTPEIKFTACDDKPLDEAQIDKFTRNDPPLLTLAVDKTLMPGFRGSTDSLGRRSCYSQTSTPEADEQRFKLFHLDVNDMIDRRKSFGEMMADMDERNVKIWRENSPLSRRGSSQHSLKSTKEPASPQPEENTSLHVRGGGSFTELSHRQPSSHQHHHDAATATSTKDTSQAMKSLLARLDSLTNHFS